MARSMNRVTLIGNLGRDPEIRSFANGSKVASLRIATTETWKDRDTGERREATEWHSVQVFGDSFIDNVIERFLKKGSRVMVEGQLKTRKWQDQSGADRYSTEISVQPFRGQVMLLDRAEGDGGSQGGNARGPGGSGAGSSGSAGGGGRGDYDDEIPF